jgi:hypothetical protein
MWNDKLQQTANQMIARYRAIDPAALTALVPDPAVVMAASPRGYARPLRSERRRSALTTGHQQRKAAVLARRASQTVREITELPGRRVMFPCEYPPCPGCASEHVIRAGVTRGEQRYRCRECNRTYYGDVKLVVHRHGIALRCHRCGTAGTQRGAEPRPHSGLTGWCPQCRRVFTQGGRRHLDDSLVVLLNRIKELGLPPDVRDEVYAQAALDVLEGRGYTFDIPLDARAGFARARGGFGSGSDHPVFAAGGIAG